MKTKFLTLVLFFFSALFCFAQEELSMIISPAALKDHAMDNVTEARWTISSPAMVSPEGGVSTVSINIEGPNDSESLSEAVSTARHYYDVDISLASEHDLLSHLVYLDDAENPLFEGSRYVPFVVDNGIVRAESIDWINVRIVDSIPIEVDNDLAGGEIILVGGQRVRLNVEGNTFFFPSDYAGQPGKLVLFDVWNSLSVFDLESGERSAYQSLSSRLTWTGIDGVYGMFPIEGSETIEMFPWWWGDGGEVWEVQNTSSLILGNQHMSRPYLAVVKNIDTGVVVSEAVEAAGKTFTLNVGDRYRVWFDWKQPEPNVVLTDVGVVQDDPGNGLMTSTMTYTYEVTARASDVYIHRWDCFGYGAHQVGVGSDNASLNTSASVVFPENSFVVLNGEQYYHLQEGESVTIHLVLTFTSTGSAMYEVDAPIMWYRYASWDVFWEKYIPGTRRYLYTGPVKG